MSLLVRASSFERSLFERAPFVISYDISSPKMARAVRRLLQRWRLDGQLSVHEIVATPSQAEALAVELMERVDAETDSLILFRLSRRGDGPVHALVRSDTATPLAFPPRGMPTYPEDGWFLVTYDIRDARRLRRVQRVTGRFAAFLQRSVYLFVGPGARLRALTEEVLPLLAGGEDDVRIYPLSGPDDLWFLCGAPPTLVGAGQAPVSPWHWRGSEPDWL